MSNDYYAINWDTYEAIAGPTTLAKAKKAARAAGHENDAEQNLSGGKWHSPVAFAGKLTGHPELWRKWEVRYRPQFKA
jgi:hypothetical protein